MIASPEDQLGPDPRPIAGPELHAWRSLISTHNLTDIHSQHSGTLFYTWDNLRVPHPDLSRATTPPQGRILKRLDRFHFSAALTQGNFDSKVACSDPQFYSDHLPLSLCISQNDDLQNQRSIYRMNLFELKKDELQIKVREAWLAVDEDLNHRYISIDRRL